MNTVLSRTAASALLFSVVACSDATTTDGSRGASAVAVVEPSVSVEMVPEASTNVMVDVSTVVSFEDYEQLQRAAWRRYEQVQLQAWRDYQAVEIDSFADYQNINTTALHQLRSNNYEAYIAWIDAEKLGNHQRQGELESANTDIATYVALRDSAFASHRATKDSAYEQYKKIKTEAYDSYKTTKAAAYAAYRAQVVN